MHGDSASAPNSYSEYVGKMAEQSREQQQQQQQQQDDVPNHPQFKQQPMHQEEEGPVRRGDGTVLKDSDKPRNPKKKMWDEQTEAAKLEQANQDGPTTEDQGEGQGRKRDEL